MPSTDLLESNKFCEVQGALTSIPPQDPLKHGPFQPPVTSTWNLSRTEYRKIWTWTRPIHRYDEVSPFPFLFGYVVFSKECVIDVITALFPMQARLLFARLAAVASAGFIPWWPGFLVFGLERIETTVEFGLVCRKGISYSHSLCSFCAYSVYLSGTSHHNAPHLYRFLGFAAVLDIRGKYDIHHISQILAPWRVEGTGSAGLRWFYLIRFSYSCRAYSTTFCWLGIIPGVHGVCNTLPKDYFERFLST